MKEIEAQELLRKYLTGSCSEKEKAMLESWYIQQEGIDLPELSQEAKDKQLLEIWNHLPIHTKVVKLRPRIAVAAAAVAVITLGVWLYYTSSINGRHPELGSGSPLANDIAPGKNKATLTLADGSVIALSEAKTGVVIDASKLSYADGEELSISSESGPRRGGPEVSSETTQFPGSRAMSVSTPRGGQYQVVLPDGTKVWLNADSKISFPSQFLNRQRKILLEGEAYFEVAKNKAKPFIVETEGSSSRSGQRVEVLGTHFNINSYADEDRIRTTLAEGSVKVSSGKMEMVLKPGEQAINRGARIETVDGDLEEVMAWKNGYFRFKAERITGIMNKLARWYNIDVVYDGEPTSEVFTGTVSRSKNISQALNMLQSTKGVKFKIEGRRVIVSH